MDEERGQVGGGSGAGQKLEDGVGIGESVWGMAGGGGGEWE